MGIGGSIFLIAVGAIVAFGVEADLKWLDLDVVGWVFMLCGATGLILTISFWRSRRRQTAIIEEHHHNHTQDHNRQQPTS